MGKHRATKSQRESNKVGHTRRLCAACEDGAYEADNATGKMRATESCCENDQVHTRRECARCKRRRAVTESHNGKRARDGVASRKRPSSRAQRKVAQCGNPARPSSTEKRQSPHKERNARGAKNGAQRESRATGKGRATGLQPEVTKSTGKEKSAQRGNPARRSCRASNKVSRITPARCKNGAQRQSRATWKLRATKLK